MNDVILGWQIYEKKLGPNSVFKLSFLRSFLASARVQHFIDVFLFEQGCCWGIKVKSLQIKL